MSHCLRLVGLLGLLASNGPANGEETGSAIFRGTQASDRAATIAGVRQTGLRCSGCHGRDASGTVAGSATIPPVDGRRLRESALARPAYDAALFARALRDGLRSDGQPLALAMPRYAFDDAQLGALWRFLSQIETDERRGVEAGRVRFAVAARPGNREEAEALRLSLERAWGALGSPDVNGRRAEFVSILADPSSGAFDDVFAVLGSEPGTAFGTELLDALVAQGIPVVGPAHLPSRDRERLPDAVWLTPGESAVAEFISRNADALREGGDRAERRAASARDLAAILALPEADLADTSLIVSIFAVETPSDLQRLAEAPAETLLVRPASPFTSRDDLADLLARIVRDGLAESGRDLTRTRFLEAVARATFGMRGPSAGGGNVPTSSTDFDVIRLRPAGR